MSEESKQEPRVMPKPDPTVSQIITNDDRKN